VTLPRSEKPWLAPESPELVWFGGADATRFLNDLISQEIGDLEPGGARRSFLLDPQGKLQFLLWVIRDDDRTGLVTDPGRGGELASTLGRYRIRVDVAIDAETTPVWVVVGAWPGYDISWPDTERHLFVGERPELSVGTAEEYELLRIEAGEPAWGRDVDEKTIPHESGLVSSAVDFDKGCFLGQELVARIDSRGGNTPRHLRRIETSDGLLAVGAPLIRGEKEVGTVTSAVGGVGLALVRREVEIGDEVVAGDVDAVVRGLPPNSRA
jgi:folate-binding protein YgfZ